MRVRTDSPRTGSAPMSAMTASWASPESRPCRVPLPAAAWVGNTWAGPSGTPLSGTFVPRALPLADMPDVMRRLLMASLAALMLIMGHERHVQTAVPVTHFQPQKNHL